MANDKYLASVITRLADARIDNFHLRQRLAELELDLDEPEPEPEPKPEPEPRTGIELIVTLAIIGGFLALLLIYSI